jgi:hypothetical protein
LTKIYQFLPRQGQRLGKLGKNQGVVNLSIYLYWEVVAVVKVVDLVHLSPQEQVEVVVVLQE